jgi:putative glycerol-1-phosphate prenyltransferase
MQLLKMNKMQFFFYSEILSAIKRGEKLLAILIDPEKFNRDIASKFLEQIPKETTHLFVGGSTDVQHQISLVVATLKKQSKLPVFLFPGNHQQIAETADALLFLSLHSGRNPEYLIGQQVKAAPLLNKSNLEIIPTSYLLIDGGHTSAVARVSETDAMSQDEVGDILNTALAGQLMGAKLLYLEAGSGAKIPVSVEIIKAVKETVSIPVIVGGGIKTQTQCKQAYAAGADFVVMGTIFEGG